MKQLAFATVVVIGVLAFDAVEAAAQEALPPWVPLSAKLTRLFSFDLPREGTGTAELKGFYVRDSRGRTFSRMRFTHSTSGLPLLRPADFGILHDRPSQLFYDIDFGRKTFRKEKTYPSMGQIAPQTREEFDKARAGEKFLGKQVISGIECEGYQVPTPHFKKHFNETWYAPSLNYLEIKVTGYDPQKQYFEVLLEDIRAGTEPDPKFFLLPSGFREVHE